MPRGAGCTTARPFRGISIPPPCSRRARSCAIRSGRFWIWRAVARDTSSTLATASSPRRRPIPWPSSWSWSMAGEPYAVILMAYGGPETLDDVAPYLLDVRGGRPTSPELVAEIRGHYAQIGGGSPIRRWTEAQAAALAEALRLPVYVCMRHWHPFIKDTVERIVSDGHRRVVAVAMAPHYSTLSVGAYEKRLIEAAGGRLELALVRSWGEHPQYLEALHEHLAQVLQRFPAPLEVQVIFTAHSLPRKIRETGDPYQIGRASCRERV